MRIILAGLAVLLWGMGLVSNAAAAENNSSNPSPNPQKQYDAISSICKAVVPVRHEDFALANGVGPGTAVAGQLMSQGVTLESIMESPSKTILTEKPIHGELRLDSNDAYVYFPNEGYLGPDQMTFVVEVMGKKFKVIETVWIANTAPEYGGCPKDYKLPAAK